MDFVTLALVKSVIVTKDYNFSYGLKGVSGH